MDHVHVEKCQHISQADISFMHESEKGENIHG